MNLHWGIIGAIVLLIVIALIAIIRYQRRTFWTRLADAEHREWLQLERGHHHITTEVEPTLGTRILLACSCGWTDSVCFLAFDDDRDAWEEVRQVEREHREGRRT